MVITKHGLSYRLKWQLVPFLFFAISFCFMGILFSQPSIVPLALAKQLAKSTTNSFPVKRAALSTMDCPKQIYLGMNFNEFTARVKGQLGAIQFSHDEDEEKMIVQVPHLYVYLSGYGEFMRPDFVFFKTTKGLLLGVIQEDITNLSKDVVVDKIATLMAVLGKPRISQTTDGSNMISTTWISDTDRHVIFSMYKYSDHHTLFLIGNTELSSELAKF